MQSRISGTGWFCVLNKYNKWIPIFKLTEDQLESIIILQTELDN